MKSRIDLRELNGMPIIIFFKKQQFTLLITTQKLNLYYNSSKKNQKGKQKEKFVFYESRYPISHLFQRMSKIESEKNDQKNIPVEINKPVQKSFNFYDVEETEDQNLQFPQSNSQYTQIIQFQEIEETLYPKPADPNDQKEHGQNVENNYLQIQKLEYYYRKKK